MKKLLLAPLIIFLMHSAHAQDTINEGKIVMAISLPDTTGEMGSMMKSMAGTEQVIYFKGENTRMEMNIGAGMGLNMITIGNQNGESYTLMNIVGKKYALKSNAGQKDSLMKVAHMQYKVKLTNETKRVLGYNCKKAVLTMEINNKKEVSDYWYTNDIVIPAFQKGQLLSQIGHKEVNGMPVETIIKMNGVSLKMTLAAIDKIPVPDSLFKVPADYTITTMDEIGKKAFGKMDTSALKPRAIEGEFPEVELNDTSGKPIKLSSLHGKFVLVDFWASWCLPCRQQNPKLVAAYKKYKNKGFTIYSISLDDSKASWVRAIAKDKLKWENQVCDFKGWKGPVCQQFGIKAIPSNYLLDKDGKVIATDLYDDALEKALKEKIK